MNEERLDNATEALLAQIPWGDTSPLNIVPALRQRIRELVEEARQQEIAFRNARGRNRANPYDAARLPDVG